MSFSRSTTAKILNGSEIILGGLVGALAVSKGDAAVEYATTIGTTIGASIGIACIVSGDLQQPKAAAHSEFDKHWGLALSGFVTVLVGGSVLLALTAPDSEQCAAYLKNAFFVMRDSGVGLVNGTVYSAIGGGLLAVTYDQLSKFKQSLFAHAPMKPSDESGQKETLSREHSRKS